MLEEGLIEGGIGGIPAANMSALVEWRDAAVRRGSERILTSDEFERLGDALFVVGHVGLLDYTASLRRMIRGLRIGSHRRRQEEACGIGRGQWRQIELEAVDGHSVGFG